MSEQLSYVEFQEEKGRTSWIKDTVEKADIPKLRDLHGAGVRIYSKSSAKLTMHVTLGLLQALRDVGNLVEPAIHIAPKVKVQKRRLPRLFVYSYATSATRSKLEPLEKRESTSDLWDSIQQYAADSAVMEVDIEGDVLEKLIDDLLPETAQAGSVVQEATELPSDSEASASKRFELLEEGWPDSGEVGQFMGSTSQSNPNQYAARLRNQRKLLGVRVPGTKLMRHPLCQFKAGELMPEMQELLEVLPVGNGSGWSQAFWLYSPHPYLRNLRPADLFRDDPASVIDAAKRQFKEEADAGW